MCYGNHRIYRHNGMNCYRQFYTREEKIEYLEEYKRWLEKEKNGVEEAIAELKNAI